MYLPRRLLTIQNGQMCYDLMSSVGCESGLEKSRLLGDYITVQTYSTQLALAANQYHTVELELDCSFSFNKK
jgi:hypothetical protein